MTFTIYNLIVSGQYTQIKRDNLDKLSMELVHHIIETGV
jgi:hypothetical protein